MKKLILFLLLPLWAMAQTSTGQEQSFPYGIVNESLQTITTPTYIGTFGTDGTQGKIPSALIAKTSDIADSLATKENIANKSDSYTASSSTTYTSTKALVEGLGTKADSSDVIHKTGEETIGLGEKYFTDNVNFTDIAVSGQAIGMAAVSPNEFVIKSQLDLKAPLSGSANYIQNQNTAPQTSNMWIDGSIKAKNIQTLDDVGGFYTYGRYSSGQPYSLNVLSDAAQGFKFTNSSAIPLLTIESSGAALFTSTVTASSFNGSATLTGTPTAPTATAGTNTTQIATTAFVQATRPYKVYTALLSQSGTSAPTATVLENTIGAIVWSRSVIGGYFATLSGAFTTDKTSVLITNGSANATYIHGAQVSPSNVNVITVADGQIDKATIEIRVYN